MLNKANLAIRFRNLTDSDDIIIKKFFLVHFINPRLRGLNLKSYLCLIWRYNNLYNNNATEISIKLSDKVTSPINDVKNFFNKDSIMQQLWPKFHVLNSIKDFTDSYWQRNCSDPDFAASVVLECYQNKNLDNNLIFYTSKEHEEYHHIIFPIKNVLEYYDERQKVLTIHPKVLEIDKILADPNLKLFEPTLLPCFSFWISWSEELEIKSYKSYQYDISYDIEMTNDLDDHDSKSYIKVSQLDTYLFLPNAYELDSQSCNYPSLIRHGDDDFELERSYSQKKLEYFNEWEKMGIKSMTAFRTHSSKMFVEYFRSRFQYLKFSFTVIDKDSQLQAGLSLTIATIIITIFWELGQNKIDQLPSLGELKFLSPEAFWLIMNSLMFLGAIRVYFFDDWFSKGASVKGIAISIGIILYFIYYFLFLILNILIKQPIQISWLNQISSFLFHKYFLIHVVVFGAILFLINKLIFKNLYRKFNINLFK